MINMLEDLDKCVGRLFQSTHGAYKEHDRIEVAWVKVRETVTYHRNQ